jgi:hypothetical protein
MPPRGWRADCAGFVTFAAVGARRFHGVLEETRRGGTVVVVPFDVKEAFGTGRPPVRATINGYTFRTTIAPMGGRFLLGLNREVRERAGVAAGQRVAVELERDDDPRVVDVPPDLEGAISADRTARETFDGLSYTHRKEYVRWIESAKREETRRRRLEKAVELLRGGVKTPG